MYSCLKARRKSRMKTIFSVPFWSFERFKPTLRMNSKQRVAHKGCRVVCWILLKSGLMHSFELKLGKKMWDEMMIAPGWENSRFELTKKPKPSICQRIPNKFATNDDATACNWNEYQPLPPNFENDTKFEFLFLAQTKWMRKALNVTSSSKLLIFFKISINLLRLHKSIIIAEMLKTVRIAITMASLRMRMAKLIWKIENFRFCM